MGSADDDGTGLEKNDVVAEAGDAMDANTIVKGSLNGASKSSGRSEDS